MCDKVLSAYCRYRIWCGPEGVDPCHWCILQILHMLLDIKFNQKGEGLV
jgi:hypothetical protein